MTTRMYWSIKILSLSMLLSALPGMAEPPPARSLDHYSAWTVAESSERLEFSEHYRSDHQHSRTTFILLAPDGTKAVIEEHYDPKRDRWTMRFEDLVSGWWAEEVLETDLSYSDMEEANQWALDRLVQEEPPVSMSFQTSDGFFVEELALPNLAVDQDRTTADMVREALEKQGEELSPVDPTTVSAVCGFRRLAEVSDRFAEKGAAGLLDAIWVMLTSQPRSIGDPSCRSMELRATPPDSAPSKAMTKLQDWLDVSNPG